MNGVNIIVIPSQSVANGFLGFFYLKTLYSGRFAFLAFSITQVSSETGFIIFPPYQLYTLE